MKLQDTIQKIPAIGPKYRLLLENLGINTILQLLEYFPRNYFDSSSIFEIADLNREERKSFTAIVNEVKSIRTRKRNFTIQTAILEDPTNSIEAVWFNQPFLKNSLKSGTKYLFSGKLNPKSYKPQLQSPQFEEIKESQTHIGIITPIYALTEGISEKWLRAKLKWITDKLDYIDDLEETLPEAIKQKYGLIGRAEALRSIHFPKNNEDLELARRRLGFEELLEIQKSAQKKRKELEKYHAPVIEISDQELKDFIKTLKFELTNDQIKAIGEIKSEMATAKPMNRLLSGDVGSGKTIVAVMASLIAAKSDFQTAILAPTTILAEQHYNTINSLIDNRKLKIELVVAGHKKKLTTDNDLNKADIIIGTHAILHEKDKLFNKLGLVIVDEQHRFGVEQRDVLKEIWPKDNLKNLPHFLNMTATPIPRTLALVAFSDISVSTLHEKPKNRKPIETHLVPHVKREDAIDWLKKQATQGTQIYWIAPLIDNNDALEVKSVENIYKELTETLPDLKITKLHGKMKPDEKRLTLDAFRNFEKNKIHILVSTSVIEVGIDIANANIIIIEGAERFGLAQLHQLRGRVGRSDAQSYCFLFTSTEPTQEQKDRLQNFVNTNDGFKLAEYDLRTRGPGEVYGTRQSGIPKLKIASIFDLQLVKEAGEAAATIITRSQ